MSERLVKITNMAFKCISEYANLRLSYLNNESKNAYIVNLCNNIIELISNPVIKQPAEATADTTAQC